MTVVYSFFFPEYAAYIPCYSHIYKLPSAHFWALQAVSSIGMYAICAQLLALTTDNRCVVNLFAA